MSIIATGSSVALDTSVAIDVLAGRAESLTSQKGKPIPENDLWIAALCVESKVRLAAVDSHFVVDGLERFDF